MHACMMQGGGFRDIRIVGGGAGGSHAYADLLPGLQHVAEVGGQEAGVVALRACGVTGIPHAAHAHVQGTDQLRACIFTAVGHAADWSLAH